MHVGSVQILDLVSVRYRKLHMKLTMKAFSDFDFPDVIRQNIELARYKKPTPVQKFALPVALFLGRDLMACAQTGSGKTAAFLLPFIAHLVINGRPAPQGGSGRNRRYMPVGLILAPTRELATQIHVESLKFTYCSSIHSVVVYGGQDIRQQFRELDRGCDIRCKRAGRCSLDDARTHEGGKEEWRAGEARQRKDE
jgi:ATP-dependent RNA helicase DDX3X